MHARLFLLALPLAAAAPPPAAPVSKRQDFSEILQLASSADIPIPTDPAVLLSLAPIIGQLASYLPTAPVLSALETAAPSGFLSAIVHDPGYAASFESAFAAGSSPSWFEGLPSTMREYLHTYDGLGGVATEFVSAEGIIASATAAAASSASLSAASETSAAASTTTGAASSAAQSSGPEGVSAGASPTTTSAATSAGATSSISSAGAPAESGMMAAGAVIVAGVLGFAAAL